jgi:exosortase
MMSDPSKHQFRQSGESLLPVLAIGGLMIAFFVPVFQWLAHVWTTSMYDAHGCLVPLIAMIMLVAKRRELAALGKTTSAAGFLLVLPGMVLMLAAVLMDLKMATGVALIVTIAGLTWSLWGKAVLKWAAFPLIFLFLMLPVNYPLEIFAGFPLRLLATKLAVGLLTLTGQSVTAQGTLITMPNFQVSIESPCSGIKTLSAMLLVGMVLAYFVHRHWQDRIVIVLLLAPVALLANAVRNYCIALIGEEFGREAAMGFLHYFSGLVVFLLSVLLLIVFSELLLWRRKRISSGS